MEKTIITKEDLIKAKEKLISMAIEYEPNQRKIFTGDSAVMLMGSKFILSDERKIHDEQQLALYPDSTYTKKVYNYSCNDYLGAILYLLHQKTGCHFMYGYYQPKDNCHRWADIRQVYDYCNDKDLIKHIKGNHIQTFTRVKLTDGADSQHYIYNELETHECTSSYNYDGMTGFSESLGDIARTEGLKVWHCFSARPGCEDFAKTGSRFSDEKIAAYASIGWNIGLLLNRGLSIEEIWPYTMEAIFKVNTDPDLDQMVKVFNILYDHILFTESAIKEKGMALAFKLPKV